MKKLFAISLAALAAGCVVPPPETTATAPSRPRLVVLIVVDGLPQRQVVDYRDQLAPDGLARFLDRGAWFAEAHYGYSYTVTAAGHSTVLTGAYPHRSGIIGNQWRDRATGEWVYSFGDPAHGYLGHATRKLDGTSPKNLRVETVGDVLRGVDPASKVVSVSGKDRSAIPTAGHKGVAYIYQSASGQFASTTYYMKEHPAWVTAFNAARPADKYFGRQWKPLLADDGYRRSLPDGQKWYRQGGWLPKTVGEGAAPERAFYAALAATPFADQLALDFARAAVAGEGLGQDSVPDILVVGLSAHDSVNHWYGAESRLSHDHLLHVDRALQDFFSWLDEKVGRDRYVAALTADHGFMPAPEYVASSGGQAGGRFNTAQLDMKLTRGLARFGQGPVVRFTSSRGVILDREAIAARGAVFDEVAEAVRQIALTEPWVAAAYTRAELESDSRRGDPFFEPVRKSWHRELSNDVELVPKRHWMPGSAGATHGSPHEYDTHVPMLLYGPAWMTPGRRDARVEVADLAPTLARILGIPAPAASEGKPLPLR